MGGGGVLQGKDVLWGELDGIFTVRVLNQVQDDGFGQGEV